MGDVVNLHGKRTEKADEAIGLSLRTIDKLSLLLDHYKHEWTEEEVALYRQTLGALLDRV